METNTSAVSEISTQVTSSIDLDTVATIMSLVNAATKSAFYMSNPKRVDALKVALNIPVSDDKSFQQFFNHSEKDLIADSYKVARSNSTTPVEVTNAQVIAEAQARYFKKNGVNAIVNEEYLAA